MNGVDSGIVAANLDNKLRYNSSQESAGAVEKQPEDEVEMIPTTLTEILTAFRAPKIIDYMSLDVEGAEAYVLQVSG